MHYRIIPTDPEKYGIRQGRWRVPRRPTCTTSGARTTRSCGRCTGLRPASHATFPHLHLYTVRPYRALPQAAADPRVSGALVHRGGRGAAERPVAHPARRVRGNPPAVSILVRGPVTADRWPVTPATTASR